MKKNLQEPQKQVLNIPVVSTSFDWEAFKTYVNTYDPQKHGGNNQRVIMDDMLYGIGLSINKGQYQWADGYRRFKAYLKELF